MTKYDVGAAFGHFGIAVPNVSICFLFAMVSNFIHILVGCSMPWFLFKIRPRNGLQHCLHIVRAEIQAQSLSNCPVRTNIYQLIGLGTGSKEPGHD